MTSTRERGFRLMKVLTDISPFFVRQEVEEMTPEEAADIWQQIEPFLSEVASRTGNSKSGLKWGVLLRKMQWIKEKAQEVTQ